MLKMLNMACHFKKYCALLLGGVLIASLLSGCITYRIDRQTKGAELHDPGDKFRIGTSTMDDVLLKLGAPTDVFSIENNDLLIYQRSLLYENRISLGIPLFDIAAGGSADISAYGSLTRYDSLVFFFRPDGVLDHMVFEEGSSKPYLRTLFSK
jgi:hypothetical protein